MTTRDKKFEYALKQANMALRETKRIHEEHSSAGFDFVQLYHMQEAEEHLKLLVVSLETREEYERLKRRVATISEAFPCEKEDPDEEGFRW